MKQPLSGTRRDRPSGIPRAFDCGARRTISIFSLQNSQSAGASAHESSERGAFSGRSGTCEGSGPRGAAMKTFLGAPPFRGSGARIFADKIEIGRPPPRRRPARSISRLEIGRLVPERAGVIGSAEVDSLRGAQPDGSRRRPGGISNAAAV